MEVLAGALLITSFAACAALEAWRPLRQRRLSRRRRLVTNGAVALTAIVTMRALVVPAVAWVAAEATGTGLGLVPRLGLPSAVSAVAAFLLFDWTIWLWHWLNHRVPVLWRFHAVHHTDLDLDVSTALRFHVGELLLSTAARAVQVVVIGIAAPVVLIFETVTNVATMFHHSNIRLPVRLERMVVWVFVTPRMHGIHHSVVERETNANWSVVFSWWDRLHRTLRLDVPQSSVTIGLPAWQDATELTAGRLLAIPFRPQRPTWRHADGRQIDRPPSPPTSRLAA